MANQAAPPAFKDLTESEYQKVVSKPVVQSCDMVPAEQANDGELDGPEGITLLASSGEVAIAESNNHRVQIFDLQGNFKRKFGSYGEEDGQFMRTDSLASDAHGNILVIGFGTSRLQVFNSKGKHLCTNSNLGLRAPHFKAVAWGKGGQLAVANEPWQVTTLSMPCRKPRVRTSVSSGGGMSRPAHRWFRLRKHLMRPQADSI